MDSLWFELVIIILLILGNGFFAGAELAIVSIRRGRIAHLAAGGEERAIVVQELQGDPHRFLATVQIGVTLVGTMASAVGGAAAVEVIKPLLQQSSFDLVSHAAEPIAFALVIGAISYLSLIFGERVPKAVALDHAERIALVVARPIRLLARIGGPAVSVLTLSSRAVLALFRIKARGKRAFVTREEIRHLLTEGRERGEVSRHEQEFIRNVFEFSETEVREVMVPRPRIVGLDLEWPREQLLRTVLDNHYSRFPVYRKEIDNIAGFVLVKDLLGQAVNAAELDLEKLVRPPLFVPEAKRVSELMREMQSRHLHLAMVIDEYGGLSGIVSTEDLLEELVGEIEDEHEQGKPKRVEHLTGGGYLVDALISLHDLEKLLGLPFDAEAPYETLAGLILYELGHLPRTGEEVAWGDYRLTCAKVSRTTILKVRIEPVKAGEQAG